MGAQLRVVLDQAGSVVVPDEAEAAQELTRALVATAPLGCSVTAIVPAGGSVDIAGLYDVQVLRRTREHLARTWAMGFVRSVGGGLIHAPSLMAPLVRHDAEYAYDQTVVTLADLRPWDAPDTLPKAELAWHRTMLRRAARFADAVVVPSHAMAARVAEIAPVEDRIRVIAGAAPAALVAGAQAPARRAALGLNTEYLVLVGGATRLAPGLRAAREADIGVVVLDAPATDADTITRLAQDAGLSAEQVHVLTPADAAERAAILAGARAVYAADPARRWPWRAIEALTLGVPLVAAASDVHADVIADGGVLVSDAEAPEAILAAMGPDAAKHRVLAADRARAFSWQSAAERVWALHADL